MRMEEIRRTFIIHMCLMIFFGTAYTFDIRSCNRALGMESGAIPDEAITASSSYVPNVGPRNGRLRIEKAGGGWCPNQPVERGIREYIQVDLDVVHMVTGLQTQGRYDRGRGQEYVEEYMVEYWRPGLQNWTAYKRWDGKQILRGNSDTASVESHRLMPAVFASRIRILPYSVHRRTVCLRLELLGCEYDDGVLAYSSPVGSEPAQGLWDSSYDGTVTVQGMLHGGLGRLVDGETGADNYRLDIGYGKGNGWVAWKNGTIDTEYVELTFEFDQIRNFSYVYLFTNNFYSRNVQVFAKAKIHFSLSGRTFNGRSLSYSYMPDHSLENARNVSIPLHHHMGRFVRLRLYFADHWIMLSEVAFDSVAVATNMTDEETGDMAADLELIINPDGKPSTADTFETIAARKNRDGYVEVVIGVLTAIMLLLLIVFVIILVLSRRHKLQGSPTLLRNPFGVTINMKDLLKTFTSSNNNERSNGGSDRVTPITTEAATLPMSISFEQYRSPLVNEYYPPNYATLRIDQTIIPNEVPLHHTEPEQSIDVTPEVPPLPTSPSLQLNLQHNQPSPPHQQSDQPTQQSPKHYHSNVQLNSSSPLHYRSLQSTPAISPKSKQLNLGNYFPRVATDPPNRKRYHTAPRDKQRIPPPVVSWNISPSMGQSYTCRETEPLEISRYSLTLVENFGSCHSGEISLYETDDLSNAEPRSGLVIVRKSSNEDHLKTDVDDSRVSAESLREVKFLSSLIDPNICQIIGWCNLESPTWTIIEYGEMGDLNQYLQFLANRNGTVRSSQDSPISVETLLYMSTQIASGMKYLESKHVVHRDLATRNCLVGRGYIVKITDIAICKIQYRKDYAEIGGRPPAPIRWLPWESILLDRYTCSSSVWSFAVTVWEILSFACEKPYQNLTNERVVQNAEHMYYGGEMKFMLEKPTICPSEIYDLLCECWKRDDTARPNFKQIYLFLKHNNNDYIPSD